MPTQMLHSIELWKNGAKIRYAEMRPIKARFTVQTLDGPGRSGWMILSTIVPNQNQAICKTNSISKVCDMHDYSEPRY